MQNDNLDPETNTESSEEESGDTSNICFFCKKGKYKNYKHNKESCVHYKRVAWRPPAVEERQEKSESDSEEGETNNETTNTVNQENEELNMENNEENEEENTVNNDIFDDKENDEKTL